MSDDAGSETPQGDGPDDFVKYLDAHMAERGWNMYDLCRESGLTPSVVWRWRKGTGRRPDIVNARMLAKALDVPILEVLVKAGRLTPEEAEATIHVQPSWSEIAPESMLQELMYKFRALSTQVESSRRELEQAQRELDTLRGQDDDQAHTNG